MGLLTYSNTVLHHIGNAFRRKKPHIPLPVLHNIHQLGICGVRTTHRGSSAGKNTRHRIRTILTVSRHYNNLCQTGANTNNLVVVPVVKWNLPTVANTNITGALCDKITEIKILCDNFNCDIFCITETWCTTLIPTSVCQIPRYTVHRRDRQDGRSHGGIACYIKENLPVIKEWHELNKQDLETLWITIRPVRMPREFTHITVGVVYHPPKSNDWDMSQHLTDCVDRILQKYPRSGILICGDFNHMKDSYLKWSCNLKQIVSKATHMNSKIDLTYTNMANLYGPPQHEPGIGLSKHQVIICKPSTSGIKPPQHIFVTKQCQGPKERAALCRTLQAIDWSPLFSLETCKEQFTVFDAIMQSTIQDNLPTKIVKRNTNDHPWVTDEFLSLVSRRQYHFHAGNRVAYNIYRNMVNRNRKQLKMKYYANKMKNLSKENPRDWWQNIKEITGRKAAKDDLQGMANSLCDGNKAQLAECINQAFQAVSDDMEPLSDADFFTTSVPSQQQIPDNYIISVSQVEKTLSKINKRKAVGPDAIPNWLLSDMAPFLAPPICAIWNSSLRESYVPGIWKTGEVCPIPKVKPPVRVDKDLRPISLTPVLSKCLESFIKEWMMDILLDVIDDHQYGSIPGSSTVLALVELIHMWLTEAEKPNTVIRILLLDFRKAFDRVDHKILLSKLASTDLPDFIINWVTAFLYDRKQCVKLGSTKSCMAHLKAGVPQGTLLGPVAFIYHINDLSTVCNTVKYVDDTTVWESCDTCGSNSKIQTAANQAGMWSNKNNMQLNIDKTKEMTVYFGHKPLQINPVTLDGQVVDSVQEFKLLGVLINDKLNWKNHLDYVCSKASSRMYLLILLKRAGRPPEDIVRVYTSIVRSVLEYASEVWHPALTKEQTHAIEHLQQRALSIAYPDMNYEDALKITQLDRLSERRKKSCARLFCNMKKSSHKLNYLLPPLRDDLRLRKVKKYELPKVRTERLKRSPINYLLFNCQ